MKRSQRAALLTLLNREMLRRGSWCGETHLQKATLFLQDLMGVDSGFEFILYRHGPFSFDLRYELSSMQADNLLELYGEARRLWAELCPDSVQHNLLGEVPKDHFSLS